MILERTGWANVQLTFNVINDKVMAHQGRIKFYTIQKQFGFVVDNDNGREYFFTRGDWTGPLKKGDDVLFDLVQGRKGIKATNIQVLEQYGND